MKRSLIFALVLALLLAAPARAAEPFHPAYLAGYPDGTVRPLAPATRAETAMMLWRLLTPEARESLAGEQTCFRDVPPGHWAYRAVSALASLGVLLGGRGGAFRPDAAITGEELAAALTRAAGLARAKEALPGVCAPREVSKGPLTRADAARLLNAALGRSPGSPDDLAGGMRLWPDNRDESAAYYLDIQEAATGHTCTKNEAGQETWTGLG